VQAVIIKEKGTVQIQNIPTPEISPDEVLVKMRACGICGTDLEKVHGEHITPPILGHEVAGEVEYAGTKVEDFVVGDRVVVHHHISCRQCYLCKNGFETLCEEYPKSNLDPCGFAEYFRVPKTLVKGGTMYKLPDSVSFEEGSQTEPTACCIRALRKAGVSVGNSVAVYGLGPVGLTHVQLLKCFGAGPVYAVDVIKQRRHFATKLGADLTFDPKTDDAPKGISLLTGGLGVDYAIVATANLKALESAFATVRKGGCVLLFGAPTRGALMSLDMSKMFLREVRFQSSYSTSETEMRMAIQLIESKRIRPSEIITDRFPLSQAIEALGLADKAGDAVKIMVENG
jgi:L-iditol 2-dehydrogenase